MHALNFVNASASLSISKYRPRSLSIAHVSTSTVFRLQKNLKDQGMTSSQAEAILIAQDEMATTRSAEILAPIATVLKVGGSHAYMADIPIKHVIIKIQLMLNQFLKERVVIFHHLGHPGSSQGVERREYEGVQGKC
jgi:hypothetical protein